MKQLQLQQALLVLLLVVAERTGPTLCAVTVVATFAVFIGREMTIATVDPSTPPSPYLALCTDYYADYHSCVGFASFITITDFVITGAFLLELGLRVLTTGFLFGPDAYIQSAWNRLDFVIICVSVASLTVSGASSLTALRSLRVLRALRPLRVIQHYPTLRLVVNSMLSAIPRVRNVFMVNLFFIFIFAVVGVQVRSREARCPEMGRGCGRLDMVLLLQLHPYSWSILLHSHD